MTTTTVEARRRGRIARLSIQARGASAAGARGRGPSGAWEPKERREVDPLRTAGRLADVVGGCWRSFLGAEWIIDPLNLPSTHVKNHGHEPSLTIANPHEPSESRLLAQACILVPTIMVDNI